MFDCFAVTPHVNDPPTHGTLTSTRTVFEVPAAIARFRRKTVVPLNDEPAGSGPVLSTAPVIAEPQAPGRVTLAEPSVCGDALFSMVNWNVCVPPPPTGDGATLAV